MTVAGRRIERSAQGRGARGLAAGRGHRDRAPAVARRARSPRPSSAPTEGDYAAAMARVVPGALRAPRHGPAGRRGPGRRRGPGDLGPGQHVGLRRADREARGPAPGPGAARGQRRHQGVDDARQPLGHDAPARAPARASWASGCWASTTSPSCPRRPRPGRLLFVEENIRNTARVMDVPLGPFRTWIALHETTHAFEFEAHPWLRPYLADRLERQLALFSDDAASMGREAVRALGAVAARRGPPRRPALAGAPDVRRAAPAVPRDAGGRWRCSRGSATT